MFICLRWPHSVCTCWPSLIGDRLLWKRTNLVLEHFYLLNCCFASFRTQKCGSFFCDFVCRLSISRNVCACHFALFSGYSRLFEEHFVCLPCEWPAKQKKKNNGKLYWLYVIISAPRIDQFDVSLDVLVEMHHWIICWIQRVVIFLRFECFVLFFHCRRP